MYVGDIITYEEAVSLLRHAISDCEHSTINELLTLAGTLEDYALTLASLGQRRRAVELAREAISCYNRTESQSVFESIEYYVALHYLASMLDTSEFAAEIVELTTKILSAATPRVQQARWNNLFVCVTLQNDTALQVLGDSNARRKLLLNALQVYPRDLATGLDRSFLVAAVANVAAEQGDIEGAIHQYEEAIALRREALARDQCSQRQASLFTALSNVANLYMRSGDYSVAISRLQEASILLVFLVDSAGQQEFRQQLINVYVELSRCYLHTKQHAEMKEVLIKAESLAEQIMLMSDGASAEEILMPVLVLRGRLASDMNDAMEAIHQCKPIRNYVFGLAVSYSMKAEKKLRANDPDALAEFQKCYWLLFGLQEDEMSYDACRSAMCAGFDLAKHLNSMPDCYPESRRVSIESSNIGMRLNRKNPNDRNGQFLVAETWFMISKMQSSYNASLENIQECLKKATALYEDLLGDGVEVSDDQAYEAGDAFAYLIDIYLMRHDCSAAINLAEKSKKTLQIARPQPHSVDVEGILLVFEFFEAFAKVMLTPSDLNSRAQMKSTSSRLLNLAFGSSSKKILQWSKAISSTEQEVNILK
jgi:tetratricopeptide (TPR) repeat protein